MKTVAIISEYNPFHNGHKYQIEKTRELLGDDTAIIAIMSGNFTQRGEVAFADKTTRAICAVECGVNLVLELPFPFSMSSAEFFAKSGVKIANELKIVDHLVFGSECGDIDLLTRIADNMLYGDFAKEISSQNNDNRELGYATRCEAIYNELFPSELNSGFFTANNILAIEYIKAIKSLNSSIIPITIKREGAGYSSDFDEETSFQSACSLRALLKQNDKSAFDYMPKNASCVLRKAINDGSCPTDEARLDSAIISSFRLNSSREENNIHDASGGLYNRISNMSIAATSISSLVSLIETKKYTRSRIKRAIWNSYFGVTSSDVKKLPLYTQILAMDKTGRSLLKKAKKMTDFPILTKPSSYSKLEDDVKKQKETSDRADAVYDLTRKNPISASYSLTFTPYVKE